VPAVVYARVSSPGQAERGHGLVVQLAAGVAWCAANGRRVVGQLADEGVPGTLEAFDQRRALAAALEQLRTGAAAELVVYRLDRLGRELVLQELVLRSARDAGGRIRSTSPAEDALLRDEGTDPAATLVRQIVGAVGEYERKLQRLRMRAGQDAKRAAGGHAAGRPPFGYRIVRGRLEPHPEHEPAIVLIRRRLRAGKSLRVIAAELDALELASPGGRGWHPYSVARVARRWAPQIGR
jgi:DNA invertase Pin-like site-specific DNA recombinase